MVSKAAILRADEAIQAALAQADASVSLRDVDGVLARRDLLSVLEEADQRLAKRIAAITPKRDGSMKFSAAQAIAYRTQVGLVIERVKYQLEPIATEAGEAAIQKSLKAGASILAKLEHEFRGVTTPPALLSAMQQSQVARGPRAALVTRVATSLDRYGQEMGAQFSRILQVGLASGASSDEIVAQLVGHGGPRGRVSLRAREVAPGVVQRIEEGDIPEGLFVRHKYWAERLVRTEVAYAANGTKLEQLRRMRADGLEVQKKIVAHFDNRTAPDSIAVHGQVRQLEENFVDGAGRLYLHPPGRPNDRETLLPWFDDWTETPATEPPTDDQIDRAEQLEKGDPIAPPPTTIDQLEQVVQQVKEAKEVTPPAEDPESAVAERLLQLERARIASVQALALKLEQEKKDAEEYHARVKVAQQSAAFTKAFKDQAPHEAALDVVRLAASKPEEFARLYAHRLGTQLPIDTFTKGATKSFEVFDKLTKEMIGAYHIDPELLDAFKRGPSFEPFLKRLETAGDSRSKQLLSALVHSEQPLFLSPDKKAISWKTSQEIAKKSPGYAAEQLRNKYLPQGNPLVEKYRATYGDLAERIGAAEARMHDALGMSLEAAIALANKKLPHHTGTARYLERLALDRPLIMTLRDKTTLREMADAVSYGHEIRAHAALLGHVKDLKPLKPKELELQVGAIMKADVKGKNKIAEYMVRARRAAEALAPLLDESLALPVTLGHKAELNPAKDEHGQFSDRESASVFGLNLTPTTSVPVGAHEYSHLLAIRHVHLGQSEMAFLDARTRGLTPRPLRDITGNMRYGVAEVAYDAGFLRPYTAREYGVRLGGKGYTDSNEVTAMGATHLFEGDVEKLYEKDEAHLFFTLSQYRGGK